MEQYAWPEKYRPLTIDDCILPKFLAKQFKSIVESKGLPNLMLNGPHGLGKTTVAKALCHELGCDYLFINGSDESGIDVLRTKIRNFASTMSMNGERKCVIIDEAEYLNPQSTQPALRSFMEEYADNCAFIFTCNYLHRVLKELVSRMVLVKFTVKSEDKVKIATQMFKRCCHILDLEKVPYAKEVVAAHVQNYFPDFRRTLWELQAYSQAVGQVDAGLLEVKNRNFSYIMELMKQKKYADLVKWSYAWETDPGFFQEMFKVVYESGKMKKESIPGLAVILNDYDDKHARAVSPQLNILACLTEVMMQCEFA